MENNDNSFYDSLDENESTSLENNSELDNNDDLMDSLKSDDNDQVSNINNKTYMCNNCNTYFMKYDGDVVCPYCQSDEVNNSDFLIGEKLFYVPYNMSDDDAIKKYKKLIKSNVFIPSFFRKKTVYEKIKKTYIPIELYNCSITGNVSFYGCDDVSKKNKKNVKKYECNNEVNIDYKNIYISKFSNINENTYNNIFNYDYSQINPYQDDVIKEEYIIKDNLSDEELHNKLEKKLMNNSLHMVKNSINHHLKKLKDNNLELIGKDKYNVLVPIYLLNIENKNKKCIFIMNGQNGEYYFDSNISIFRVLMFGIFLFLIIFVLTCLFAYYI